MYGYFMRLGIALVVSSALFGVLERVWPAVRDDSRRHASRLTDFAYWWFNPVGSHGLTRIALVAAAIPFAVLLGGPTALDRIEPWIRARHTLLSSQPAWAQALQALVLGDFISYWSHRLTHRRLLWRFHAVHHAIVDLDYLAAQRSHPINEAFTHVVQALPLLLLGYRLDLLVAAAPLTRLYAISLHANLSWSFGPLRYVLASPTFHRWHHSAEQRGLDKNFASFFPVWDLVFGTFYMPVGELPQRFGVEDDVPTGFLAQLVWPLRRARPRPAIDAATCDTMPT